MTNYEHYKNEIDKITRMGRAVAIDKKTGEMRCCETTRCLDCLFQGKRCHEKIIEWADEEYKEPTVDWSNVSIDTPILVRDFDIDEWSRCYFAGLDHAGKVMTWDEGRTSWSTLGDYDTSSWMYAKLAKETE